MEENALIKAIEQGFATAQNIEEAQRALKIGIASNILGGIKSVKDSFSTLEQLEERVNARVSDLLNENLQIMALPDVMEILKYINRQKVEILESLRKIAQGKDILSDYPTLSDEEKATVEMLKAMTAEQKSTFFTMLKQAYKDPNEDEFKEENDNDDES